MPQHKTMLPQAGPVPVFQTALKDSRFGFSATDRSFNLTHHASNQGHSLKLSSLTRLTATLMTMAIMIMTAVMMTVMTTTTMTTIISIRVMEMGVTWVSGYQSHCLYTN